MSVLKIKDQNGQWTDVLSIKGEKGDNGQDYVLTENDKQEIAQDVAEMVDTDMVVTFTIPWVNNDFGEGGTADKTFTEIKTAVLEGKHVIGKLYITANGMSQFLTTLPIVTYLAEIGDTITFSTYSSFGHDSDFKTINTIMTVFIISDETDDTIIAKRTKEIATEEYVRESINAIPDAPVKDVQVNGASVVSDGVANISIPEPDPKGMVVKTTLVSDNRYTIDSTYDIIKTTLSAGINVIVMAQNIPQPYVGNIQMDGVWYLAFGVSTTYNNYATLMGFLIPETYQNIAVWVEQSVHIPTLDDSDIDANIVWSSSKISNELSQKVGDVQINGTSIVSNGVANIPFIGYSQHGIAKLSANTNTGGLSTDATGVIYIDHATSALIKTGTNRFRPVAPDLQHESVFYGLAKAAGDTTQSASSNAVGSYTDDAKTAIRTMLGIDTASLVAEIKDALNL